MLGSVLWFSEPREKQDSTAESGVESKSASGPASKFAYHQLAVWRKICCQNISIIKRGKSALIILNFLSVGLTLDLLVSRAVTVKKTKNKKNQQYYFILTCHLSYLKHTANFNVHIFNPFKCSCVWELEGQYVCAADFLPLIKARFPHNEIVRTFTWSSQNKLLFQKKRVFVSGRQHHSRVSSCKQKATGSDD